MASSTHLEDVLAPGLTPPEQMLSEVVNRLSFACEGPASPLRRSLKDVPLPSRAVIGDCVKGLRKALFPGYFGDAALNTESTRFNIGVLLEQIQAELTEQVRRGLCFACTDLACAGSCEERSAYVVQRLLTNLPAIQRMLVLDAQAGYTADPACTNAYEPVFCYPYMTALTHQRIAHELFLLGVPLIPRLITEMAHSETGIDIHPGAEIGESCFIDHGTGVVIGETCRIGKRVRLYQSVTLGAKSFELGRDGHPVKGVSRHPVLEDDVTVYSGATILGRVTIGAGSIIGGNVWLTHSVPPGSRVYQHTARIDRFSHGAGI